MPARVTSAHIAKNGRFDASFYEGFDTITLAQRLLGKRLVTQARGIRVSGIIVETEAYLGVDDPACHAARGETKRNRVMFQEPGHCYVYLIYGMYHCVNVVSDPKGVGSAVLIRAVEPSEGTEVMARRRSSRQKRVRAVDMTRGPGRLCDALGITTQFSGEHLATSHRIWIEPHIEYQKHDVSSTGRIGISAGRDLLLRFFVKGSQWVSGPTL